MKKNSSDFSSFENLIGKTEHVENYCSRYSILPFNSIFNNHQLHYIAAQITEFLFHYKKLVQHFLISIWPFTFIKFVYSIHKINIFKLNDRKDQKWKALKLYIKYVLCFCFLPYDKRVFLHHFILHNCHLTYFGGQNMSRIDMYPLLAESVIGSAWAATLSSHLMEALQR